MNRVSIFIILLISVLVAGCVSPGEDDLPIPEGPYLGQTPPGSIPEVFAPGIVSTKGWEYGGAFTPDLNEFYFIREVGETEENKKQEFVVIRNIKNRWHESVISPRVGQPFISTDGKTMHLGRRYKALTEAGWSEIKNLGPPLNDIPIMRLTASSNGLYVFDELDVGIIQYSRLVNGKLDEPRAFGAEINAPETLNAHPFIAPDESYLIWDARRESGYGNADIYISFRQQDGSWGEAINLGKDINTSASEYGASVTPDGKYLFFNRSVGPDNTDLFWVDAQFIENLRPK